MDRWMAKHRPAYPIVIVKGNAFDETVGVKFFPTAVVMDPEGVITYSGSAGAKEKPLGQALEDADRGPLFPRAFDDALEALVDGEYGASYAEVLELIEKGKLDEREAALAAAFRGHLEGLAASAPARGRAELEEGLVHRAERAVLPFAGGEPAFPASPDCAAFLEEVRALPDFERELAAGKVYDEAAAHADAQEYLDAVKTYKRLLRRFEGTKVAAAGRAQAEELLRTRKPGYKPTCPSCRKGGRACERHFEDVRL